MDTASTHSRTARYTTSSSITTGGIYNLRMMKISYPIQKKGYNRKLALLGEEDLFDLITFDPMATATTTS